MAGYAATVTIDAPPDDVWSLVADIASHPRWAADELVVEPTGEGTWRTTARAKGREFTAELVVTDAVPPERFAFDVADQTGQWHHRFEIEPADAGCRVTRRVEVVELTPGQRLLYWVVRLPVKVPSLRTSLQRLAELAEV